MIHALPATVREVLEEGAFCHVSAVTASGPHVTPMVFATAGDRVWVTTSRGSVKARAWAEDPRAAGLVRAGERSVAISGTVTTYDLTAPDSWGRSVRHGATISRASARFTRKNARFFAGYAVDAHHVPFAWTPPGRVFASLTVERAVLLEDGSATPTWKPRGLGPPTASTFRAAHAGSPPLAGLPDEVTDRLGTTGPAALGLATPEGPFVLPARWLIDGPAVYAALPAEVLALAGLTGPEPRVALEIDRASWWRARAMVGAMVRGSGRVVVLDRLTSGLRSARAVAIRAGIEPDGAALVRVRPDRLVWWRGWSSGTVKPA